MQPLINAPAHGEQRKAFALPSFPASPVSGGGRLRSEYAVILENVVKNYRNCRALDGISLAVPQGAAIGFVGCNGAGKTTAIFAILGLVTPSTGRVIVLGHDMRREPYRVLGRMNFASPYVNMPARLTVRQNLRIFAHLYGLRGVENRLAQLAHEFELSEFLDRALGTLSAGQKTRVSLAKALLNEPDILLLDEPTASLDPGRSAWVHCRLEAYRRRRGATLILTSHNVAEVEKLCDRVAIMSYGRIVELGAVAVLRHRYPSASLGEVSMMKKRSGTTRNQNK
jgi:ABC-2 type transport system ATP-binding protein